HRILSHHNFRARLEIHHRSWQRRSHPVERDRTQNVLRRVLLEDLLESALRKIGGQRRRVALVAFSLRQQPGQLPQLRRRHHAHSVEHHIHQHVPLIEQHAVIQKSRLPANCFLRHLSRIVVSEGAVSAAGISKHCCLDYQTTTVVATVGGLLQTLEAILLQHRRIHCIGGGGIGTRGDSAFPLPAGKLAGKNCGRRDSCREDRARRDGDRRGRLSSEGPNTKKGAEKKYEYHEELSREFHSKKGTHLLLD